MSQGTLDPKSRFLGQKMCFVARVQTDTQTDRQTRKWIHRTPFQGFRNFSFSLSSRIGPIDKRGSTDVLSEDSAQCFAFNCKSVSNRLYDAIHTRRDEQLACMFHWGMLRWYQYLICHSVMVGICCLSGEWRDQLLIANELTEWLHDRNILEEKIGGCSNMILPFLTLPHIFARPLACDIT